MNWEWLDKVPWELILVLIVFPLARKLGQQIEDARLRAVYLKFVQWAEQKYGPSPGTEKKKKVVQELVDHGELVDDKLLEAMVYEAKKAA